MMKERKNSETSVEYIKTKETYCVRRKKKKKKILQTIIQVLAKLNKTD